jgi:threonine/homoserine/homoserine lactone efflux protein
MWLYILQGIGYGLAAAAQPGPLQTYLISQALTKGWKQALPAALAPLISDGPILAFSLLVISQLPARLERFLYIAGGLFVLYLAYSTYRSWKYFDSNIPSPNMQNSQSLLKAALVNVLNPNPYLFWSLVTGPIFLTGWRQTPVHGLSFIAGFYATMIIGLATIIVVFGSARQLGPRVNHALLGISALALMCFGLFQLWLGITN